MTEERLKDFPEDVGTLIFKCRALMALDRWDEAEETYGFVKEHFASFARFYLDRGHWMLKMGRREEALECLQRGLALLPSRYFSEEWLNLSKDIWEERGHRELEVGVDSLPGDDFYTITMAELYLSQGMVNLAREILRVIAKREPENERALSLLHKVEGNENTRGIGEDKRLFVISELERWLNNLERLRKS
ncbi:MAG: hypothetical protein N2317_00090 [Syntrophales bacterium]|nr:hypothetical protein [Syntrophales bacterium]